MERNESKEAEYTEPKLFDFDGDLSKNWYVEAYILNPATGKKERKRYKSGINRYQTTEERYNFGEQIITTLKSDLVKGKRLQNKSVTARKGQSIIQAIEALALLKAQKNIAEGYKRRFIVLGAYAKEYFGSMKRSGVSELSTGQIEGFLDWLEEKKGLAPKTVNQFRANLNELYLKLIKDRIVDFNPVADSSKRREVKGETNFPFSVEQVQAIVKDLESHGFAQVALYVKFLFFTLARPGKEIGLLRCGDVKDKVIQIAKESGKTGFRTVDIAPALGRLIDQAGVRNAPASFYVFGSAGLPSPKPRQRTYFYKKLVQSLKRLGFTERPYTLYSFKHSGACAMYDQGVPLYIIQKQCGHARLSQTEDYMINLGKMKATGTALDNLPDL
jgi:integrase